VIHMDALLSKAPVKGNRNALLGTGTSIGIHASVEHPQKNLAPEYLHSRTTTLTLQVALTSAQTQTQTHTHTETALSALSKAQLSVPHPDCYPYG